MNFLMRGFIFLPLLWISAKGETTVTACRNEHVKLICPEESTILVTEAIYGRTDADTCRNSAEQDEPAPFCRSIGAESPINQKCFGKSTCDVTANEEFFDGQCPSDEMYLAATYKCVPKANITEICSKFIVRLVNATTGVITSPVYPNFYPDEKSCTVSIKPRPGFRYDLHVVDLDIEDSHERNCHDMLLVRDEADTWKRYSYCGHLGAVHAREPLHVKQLKDVTVVFRTNNKESKNRGFLLTYNEVEAKPTHEEL